MAKDLKIDTETWDIILDDSNDWELVEDADEVAQRVAVALKWHRGEWLFNTDLGLPYRDQIMVKNPQLDQIRGIMRTLITGIEDVEALTQLELDYSPTERKLRVSGTISTIYGPATFGAAL